MKAETWSVWHVNTLTGERALWGGHGGLHLSKAEAEEMVTRINQTKQMVPSRAHNGQLWKCIAVKDTQIGDT